MQRRLLLNTLIKPFLITAALLALGIYLSLTCSYAVEVANQTVIDIAYADDWLKDWVNSKSENGIYIGRVIASKKVNDFYIYVNNLHPTDTGYYKVDSWGHSSGTADGRGVLKINVHMVPADGPRQFLVAVETINQGVNKKVRAISIDGKVIPVSSIEVIKSYQ